jgi:hypothetical protein
VITFAELQCCSLSSNYVCRSYHTCFRKEAVSWHKDRTPSLQHPLIHPESGCLPISLLPNKPASPTKIHPGPICKKMIIANHHISNLWSPNKSFASDTVIKFCKRICDIRKIANSTTSHVLNIQHNNPNLELLNDFGDLIQFDYARLLRYLVKVFGLKDKAMSNGIDIAQ